MLPQSIDQSVDVRDPLGGGRTDDGIPKVDNGSKGSFVMPRRDTTSRFIESCNPLGVGGTRDGQGVLCFMIV